MITYSSEVLKDYISLFGETHHFPEAALKYLLCMFDKLMKEEVGVEFLRKVNDFCKLQNYDELFDKELTAMAKKIGVHPYTVHLIYLICLCPYTRQLYEANGLDESIFHDSVEDLYISMIECYDLHKIWGTHYGRWQVGVCNMTLITFGRLQYNTFNIWCDYERKGYKVKKNDLVIEVHIPSGRPLKHEACLASYKAAETYYRNKYFHIFGKGVIPFVCFSWLLYPPTKIAFVESRNILEFIGDYDIFNVDSRNNDEDLWRVYGKDYRLPFERLPKITSLQRHLADYLEEGNHLGYGHGICLFKDGEIVNT